MTNNTQIAQITQFNFNDNEVRCQIINNEPWFVAKDVALLLGYTNPQKAIRDHCKKGILLRDIYRVNDSFTLDEFDLQSQTKMIKEDDIFRLIVKSSLPEAERIEEWITKEVLPAIRKHLNKGYTMTQDTQITPFNYGDNVIRIIKDETTGEPLWIAKDVCDVLGYKDVSMTLSKLDDDERGTKKICTLGGNQEMSVITESGMYTLIIRSNKIEAKQFKRWVTHEVLPSIRKYGHYEAKPQPLVPTASDELSLNLDRSLHELDHSIQLLEFLNAIVFPTKQKNTLEKRGVVDSLIENVKRAQALIKAVTPPIGFTDNPHKDHLPKTTKQLSSFERGL
ncbi:MAG: BRO family protein [Sulfurimonas sp.]|jgi:prophage antirepressor-like protein